MEENDLIEKNEKEEIDRFIEWVLVNDRRFPSESALPWWDSPQAQAQLQLICCGDSEISVHVGYSGDEEQRASSWFHATAPSILDDMRGTKDVILYD